MTPDELREAIEIELDAIQVTVNELIALQRDVLHREPTVREQTAAAAFLAQFYNGVESILKRICLYHDVPLPTGETWHVDLFKRFCSPGDPNLPQLFNDELASALSPYRRFRHVAFHSYGFQFDWERMSEGVEQTEEVYQRFRKSLAGYLQTVGE